jgi:hypothetical protein
MLMGFELVDGYLLGEPVSKPDALAALLAERSLDLAAAPLYRGLEAVGPRAADEAFIALRLVLAGRAPTDEHVRRVRALAALARACANGDAAGVAQAFKRDGAALSDLESLRKSPPAELGAAARAAFVRELTPRAAAGESS